jgi:Domain of unknown function (DUF4389)
VKPKVPRRQEPLVRADNTIVVCAYRGDPRYDVPDESGRPWLLAIPHYLVLAALAAGAMFASADRFCAVLVTGEYPQAIQDYLVAVFGCGLRAEAYAGLLTDTYPPFGLTA